LRAPTSDTAFNPAGTKKSKKEGPERSMTG